MFVVAYMPGALHNGDDSASSRQNGTTAPRWSSSGKVADFSSNSYQDGKQNELPPVLSSDGPWNANKAEEGICRSTFKQCWSIYHLNSKLIRGMFSCSTMRNSFLSTPKSL